MSMTAAVPAARARGGERDERYQIQDGHLPPQNASGQSFSPFNAMRRERLNHSEDVGLPFRTRDEIFEQEFAFGRAQQALSASDEKLQPWIQQRQQQLLIQPQQQHEQPQQNYLRYHRTTGVFPTLHSPLAPLSAMISTSRRDASDDGNPHEQQQQPTPQQRLETPRRTTSVFYQKLPSVTGGRPHVASLASASSHVNANHRNNVRKEEHQQQQQVVAAEEEAEEEEEEEEDADSDDDGDMDLTSVVFSFL